MALRSRPSLVDRCTQGNLLDKDNTKLDALGKVIGGDNDPRLDGLVSILTSMQGVPPDRNAPVREVLARLGDRWSALLLMVLQTGVYRHAELKRVVSILSSEQEISQRILTLRLRALERDGFVARKITDTIPPRVDYQLTPLGHEITIKLVEFVRWIEDKNEEVLAARERFET